MSVDVKGDDVQTIYDVGMEPEWKLDPPRKEPFCAVKNGTIEMLAKFNATKNLTFPTNVKICEHEDYIEYAVEKTWQNWPSEVLFENFEMSNNVAIESTKLNCHYIVVGATNEDDIQNWQNCGASSNIIAYITGSVCRFGAMFSPFPLEVTDQSFALKGQYIPARRIAAGSIAQRNQRPVRAID